MNVALTVNDTATATVTPTSLVFSPTNYTVPQVIYVSAIDNSYADGTRPVRIVGTPSSTDPVWAAATPASILALVTDDDQVRGG